MGKDLTATLVYCKDTGRRPYLYSYPRSEEQRVSTPHQVADVDNESIQVEVRIRDGRGLGLTLAKNGFKLCEHKTSLKTADFYTNREKVMEVYYEEIADLVKKETGAAHVHMFHHDLRNNSKTNSNNAFSHAVQTVKTYLPYVHTDSHHRHAETEFVKYAQNDPIARENSKGRFIFFTCWRSIDEENPVEDFPLTVCDETSLVKPDDYVTTDLHLHETHIKQVYHLKEGNQHRHKWYYFPEMKYNEVIMFKNWDSDRDSPARMVFHSSFKDPSVRVDSIPRHSIECRGYAYFPDHEPDTCSHLVTQTTVVPVEEAISRIYAAVNAFRAWLPTAQVWAKGLVEIGSYTEIYHELVRDHNGSLGLQDCPAENKQDIVAALLADHAIGKLLASHTAYAIKLEQTQLTFIDKYALSMEVVVPLAAATGMVLGASLMYFSSLRK